MIYTDKIKAKHKEREGKSEKHWIKKEIDGKRVKTMNNIRKGRMRRWYTNKNKD